MSLQLVRSVELFIAARVASVTTTNAGERHKSTEDRCINSSWTIKRSTTLLLSSTQMGASVQLQEELHCFSPSGEGQEINRLLQGCVASARLHTVCVSLGMLLKAAGSRSQLETEILQKELQGGWNREKPVSASSLRRPTLCLGFGNAPYKLGFLWLVH